jgi:hypothetical protein
MSEISSGQGRILRHGKDGSAPSGAARGPRPVEHHSAPRPPPCIPNKWDETGRLRATAAIASVCTDAKSRLLLSALRHQSIHFPPQFLNRRGERGAARVDHNIPFRRHVQQTHSQDLPQAALHAISQHGFPERSRHRKPQTRTCAFRFLRVRCIRSRTLDAQEESREVTAGEASPLIVSSAEIGGSENPGGFREAVTRRWRSERLSRR